MRAPCSWSGGGRGRFAHLSVPLEHWEERVGLGLGREGVPGEVLGTESPVTFPFPSGPQKEKVEEGRRDGRAGPLKGVDASVKLNFIRSQWGEWFGRSRGQLRGLLQYRKVGRDPVWWIQGPWASHVLGHQFLTLGHGRDCKRVCESLCEPAHAGLPSG